MVVKILETIYSTFFVFSFSLTVFVLRVLSSYVYLLYLMCICCTVLCVYCCSYFKCGTAG